MPGACDHSESALSASDLRVIVTGPPHCGQEWLTQALAAAYGLELLAGSGRPVGRRRGACRRRADAAFAAGSIYATRSAYSSRLVDRWRSQPVHIVTVVRDPYDLYAELEREEGSLVLAAATASRAFQGFEDSTALPTIPDRPDDLLLRRFEKLLRRAVRWSLDERVLTVRHEDLRDDPVRAIAALAGGIRPVGPHAIEDALRASAPHRLRAFRQPGEEAPGERLRSPQLEELRWRCADDISLLGYAIR